MPDNRALLCIVQTLGFSSIPLYPVLSLDGWNWSLSSWCICSILLWDHLKARCHVMFSTAFVLLRSDCRMHLISLWFSLIWGVGLIGMRACNIRQRQTTDLHPFGLCFLHQFSTMSIFQSVDRPMSLPSTLLNYFCEFYQGLSPMFPQGSGTAGRGFGETHIRDAWRPPPNFREIQQGRRDAIVIQILKILKIWKI